MLHFCACHKCHVERVQWNEQIKENEARITNSNQEMLIALKATILFEAFKHHVCKRKISLNALCFAELGYTDSSCRISK